MVARVGGGEEMGIEGQKAIIQSIKCITEQPKGRRKNEQRIKRMTKTAPCQ